MDFKEQLKGLAEKAKKELAKPRITEESTKNALIMPMFQCLGYNVFDTDEFCPEYSTSWGKGKDARTDYAIIKDGNPVALIECKPCNERNLDQYEGQLRSYFGPNASRLGILTNGIEYRFYTDLDKDNVLDDTPFFTFDLLNASDEQINYFERFRKENLDQKKIRNSASQMRLISRLTAYLSKELSNADDEFTQFVLKQSKAYGDGAALTAERKAQAKPVIQKAISGIVNARANQKLREAQAVDGEPEEAAPQKLGVVTTEEELDAFRVVQEVLSDAVPAQDITYHDTKNYFAVMLQGNSWKHICRFYFDLKQKQIGIYNGTINELGQKNFNYHTVDSPEDIRLYRDELISAVGFYQQKEA